MRWVSLASCWWMKRRRLTHFIGRPLPWSVMRPGLCLPGNNRTGHLI